MSEVGEGEVVGEREGKETEGDGGAFLLAKVMKLSSQRTIMFLYSHEGLGATLERERWGRGWWWG